MGRVQLLSEDVIKKIAAGEVVERPASVVKELVENSIDARANKIIIDLEDGGKKRITVSDDGCGLHAEDCLLALKRHATSKIIYPDDLFAISTLGFRGEALAAISAIADFSLASRRHDQAQGAKVTIEGEEPILVPWSGSAGTSITVANLFSKLPVRAKFLKGSDTEFAHCLELIQALALANPNISFSLSHNGKIRFNAPALDLVPDSQWRGELALRERWALILGKEEAQQTLYVNESNEYGRWEALISAPGHDKATNKSIFNFVNGRWVKDKILNFGILRGYHSHILKGRHPQVLSFFDSDPSLIDVNAHPAKMELRFQYPAEVQGLIGFAIRRKLREASWATDTKEREGMGRDLSTPLRCAQDDGGTTRYNPANGGTTRYNPANGGTTRYNPDNGGTTRYNPDDGKTSRYNRDREISHYDPDDGGHTNHSRHDGKNTNDSRETEKTLTRSEELNNENTQFNRPEEKSWQRYAAPTKAQGASQSEHSDKRSLQVDQEPSQVNTQTVADSIGSLGMTTESVTPPVGSLSMVTTFDSEEELRFSRSISPTPSNESAIQWRSLKFLGTFAKCYLFFEDEYRDKLLAIDQHAFHERILYERLCKEQSLLAESQALMIPETVVLAAQHVSALQDQNQLIRSAGFKIEFIDERRIAIKAVPTLLMNRACGEILVQIIESVSEGEISSPQEIHHQVLATLACHAAVRAGEELHYDDLKVLLRDAEQVDFFHNCPHGRRVFKWIEKNQVASWFDR